MRHSLSARRLAAVAAATFPVVGGVPFLAGTAAHAATSTRYVATNGSDSDNDCTVSTHPCLTIQYAVGQADSGDTVSVAAGSYDESVRIRTTLTIVGAGSTGSGRTTIDGAAESGASVFVDGSDQGSPITVTIRATDVSGNSDDDGVYVTGASTVNVRDSVVSNNDDDGVDLGDSAHADIQSSTISGNGEDGVDVDGEGAAVATVQGSVVSRNENGGVYVGSGTAHVTASTLDANVGAGMVLDGDGAAGTLTTSTVSNTVPFSERDGETFGGGLLRFGGTLTIDTSTIFGNSGQGVLDVAHGTGSLAIANSTISGTVATDEDSFPQGGVAVATAVPELQPAAVAANPRARFATSQPRGITPKATSAVAAESSLTVVGTIVADNTTLADCATGSETATAKPLVSGDGPATDGGYNLDSDGSCDFTSATHSISKGDAKLGALADNGGPTKTLLPAKGSDAIDAIPTGKANCSSTATDQRGVARPQGTTDRCDIGAVEATQTPIVVTPADLPHGTVGMAYHVALSASGGLGAPYELSLAPGSKPLPHGITLSPSGVLAGTPTESGTFPFTVSVDDPTLQNYVLVIAAAASPTSSAPAPNGNSAAPIANTGAHVGGLTSAGALAVLLGLLVLLTAGWVGRSPGRHRLAARRTH